MPDYKTCKKCGQSFPATSEYFRVKKSLKSGLQNTCRSCGRVLDAIRRRKNGIPEKEVIRKDGLKRCPQCKSWLPATPEYFHSDRRNQDGLASICKPCNIQHVCEYQKTHKDKVNAKNREYCKRHPERIRAFQQAYAARQKSLGLKRVHTSKPPEQAHEQFQRWYHKHIHEARESKRLRESIRRANNKQAGGLSDIKRADWKFALEYFGNACAVCGRPAGLFHMIAADHWIPIELGGYTVKTNIVPLCHGVGGCNNSKKDRMPDIWLQKKFGRRKANMILKRIEQYFSVVRDRDKPTGDVQ